jgi:cardiolipin synthase
MRKSRRANQYTPKNKVKVLRGGIEYFDKLEQLIDSAQYGLHLQTYIYDEDETGTRIANALVRAAARKVQVYVLLDGYASQSLSSRFINMLKDEGINFSFFEPALKSTSFYFGRRLHHKVVVADSNACLVSGANISNRYNDLEEAPAWLDWAIYAEGNVARHLTRVCNTIWNRSVLRKRCTIDPFHFVAPLPDDDCLVRVRRNDWVHKKTEITRTYREMLNTAHRQVTIMTSYFWPPRRLLRRMAVATRRGVRVRLILTATADVPFAKYTERYLYPWLLRNNVEIYEYEKNILHGKLAVSDHTWITAGSYNVNHISAFASVELNLDIRDTAIASDVSARFDKIIGEDCRQITEDNFKADSSLIKRFFYYISYRLVHIIFYLFTFYFVQKKAED